MLRRLHWKPHRPAVAAHSPTGAEALPGISCFYLFSQASFVLSKNHLSKNKLPGTEFFFFFFGGGYPWRLHESQNTLVSTLKPSKVKCQRSVQSTLKAMVETSKGTTQRQVWCCWICRSDCPGSSLGTKHPPPLWPWGRLLTTNFSFSHLENR